MSEFGSIETETSNIEAMSMHEMNYKLTVELQNKENEIKDLKDLINELRTQDLEKSNAIKMASSIIESLRKEFEGAAREVGVLEKDNQKLMHEKIALEKELQEKLKDFEGSRNENFVMDKMKRLESESNETIQRLKNETRNVTLQAAQKQFEYAEKLNRIENEKKELEAKEQHWKAQFYKKENECLEVIEKLVKLEENYSLALSQIEKLKRNENIEIHSVHSIRGIDIVRSGTDDDMKSYKSLSPKLLTTREYRHNQHLRTPKSAGVKFSERLSSDSDTSPMPESRSPCPEMKGRKPSIRTPPGSAPTSPKKRSSPLKVTSKDINVKRKFEAMRRYTFGQDPAEEKKKLDELRMAELIKAREQRPQVDAAVAFFKMSMSDLVDQQKNLFDYIDKMTVKEASAINKMVDEVFEKEVTIRPELERWIMRNEELEQRFFEAVKKVRSLEKLVYQSKSTLELAQKQRKKENDINKQYIRTLELKTQFMESELDKKNRAFFELLCEYKDNILQQRLDYQQALHSLQLSYRSLKENFQSLVEQKTDIDAKYDETKQGYDVIKENLVQIEKSLGFEPLDSVDGAQAEVSQARLTTLDKRIKSLLELEKGYYELKKALNQEKEKSAKRVSYFEQQVETLTNERNAAVREETKLQGQINRFEETVRTMKENLNEHCIKIRSLEMDKESLNREFHEAKKELELLKESVVERNQQIFNMKIELKKAREAEAELRGQLDVQETVVAELQRQLEGGGGGTYAGLKKLSSRSQERRGEEDGARKSLSEDVETFRGRRSTQGEGDNTLEKLKNENNYIKQYFQKRVNDSEAMLGFIEMNLQKMQENYFRVAEGEFFGEERIQEITVHETGFNRVYTGFKTVLQAIALQVQKAVNDGIEFAITIAETMMFRLNLSFEEKKNIEANSHKLVNLSLRPNKDLRRALSEFQELILATMRRNTWDNSTASSLNDKRKSYSINSNRAESLRPNIDSLIDSISILSTNLLENPSKLKDTLETLNNLRDLYVRKSSRGKLGQLQEREIPLGIQLLC